VTFSFGVQDSLQSVGTERAVGARSTENRGRTTVPHPFREFNETLVFDLLDFAPGVIKQSTSFGLSESINYRLGSPGGNSLFDLDPNEPCGVPIIDKSFIVFMIQLIQDPYRREYFKAGPTVAMKVAALTVEQIASTERDYNGPGDHSPDWHSAFFQRAGPLGSCDR
jgi:hypothetical protein